MHLQQDSLSSRLEWGKGVYLRVLITAAGIAAATVLHYVTPPSMLLWHNIFQRLYYLPIVYASIYFGWRGGLLAAACSALCYVPHILFSWHQMPDYAMNQYSEIIVFFLVGGTTGVLADREQKQAKKLMATTEQLSKVYRDLQESFEQVKRADRLSAIGQLSASLVHEIRNPLGSIEGATDILEQPQTSEEMRKEFLDVIRKECRRLNGLLTNLLDFARPRRPEFRSVNLEHVIDSVITLLSPTAEQSRVTLRRRIPAALPLFECDPEQLRQVILNLTINAIQAMPEGGDIELAANQRNSSIFITVKDQGSGVDPETLDRIFDPFFTTKQNGTGLGLSVAHQIVAQHGGAITATRNEDRGMTFSVVLPLRDRRHS